MTDMEGSLRCPVCKAGFRDTKECTRCGADLSILMTLVAAAQLCREKARAAIYRCNFAKAHDFAAKAQKIHSTETGRQLLLLTSWLHKDTHLDNHGCESYNESK